VYRAASHEPLFDPLRRRRYQGEILRGGLIKIQLRAARDFHRKMHEPKTHRSCDDTRSIEKILAIVLNLQKIELAKFIQHWQCGRRAMALYFFDLIGKEDGRRDFRGRELPTPEEALRTAELIAFDLATGPEEQWVGWSVVVHGADGRELFTVPIQALCLTAA
jgi:hypothetical protein